MTYCSSVGDQFVCTCRYCEQILYCLANAVDRTYKDSAGQEGSGGLGWGVEQGEATPAIQKHQLILCNQTKLLLKKKFLLSSKKGLPPSFGLLSITQYCTLKSHSEKICLLWIVLIVPTLLDKLWRILQYLTDDAIAKLYLT